MNAGGEIEFSNGRKHRKQQKVPYLNKTVTIVRSVNGKPLSEVAPGMPNRFDSAVDAIRKVRKAIGDPHARIITKQLDIATASIMRV